MADYIIIALRWLVDPFRLTTIILPGVVVFGSNAVRWERGVTLTSGADTLLAIALFDLTAIVSSEDIQRVVSSEWVRSNMLRIHVVFLLLTAAAWYLLVARAEPYLKGKSKASKATLAFFVAFSGLALAAAIFALHVVTYRFQG